MWTLWTILKNPQKYGTDWRSKEGLSLRGINIVGICLIKLGLEKSVDLLSLTSVANSPQWLKKNNNHNIVDDTNYKQVDSFVFTRSNKLNSFENQTKTMCFKIGRIVSLIFFFTFLSSLWVLFWAKYRLRQEAWQCNWIRSEHDETGNILINYVGLLRTWSNSSYELSFCTILSSSFIVYVHFFLFGVLLLKYLPLFPFYL